MYRALLHGVTNARSGPAPASGFECQRTDRSRINPSVTIRDCKVFQEEEHSLRSKRTRVPPPHPDRRREPLPEQQPKATQDDPHALQAIRAILDSPSYRLAERDVDFLARYDVRGPRLQLEYIKPDTVLREHRVEHTIVVFGSTRIPESPRRASLRGS
jgi:hypothetical protein